MRPSYSSRNAQEIERYLKLLDSQDSQEGGHSCKAGDAQKAFGTIKHQILGNARLLVRGMKGAQAELSLAVLAYNLKRVFNMKGANWMHEALQG